jgi:5,10-methylenetetrahydrofolate reductase
VKEAGVKIGTAMCRTLLDAGVKGLHFYTLNLEKVRTRSCHRLP